MPEIRAGRNRAWPRVAMLAVAVVLGTAAGPPAAVPEVRAATRVAEPMPGAVVPVAGIGESGFSGDGHPAKDARLGKRLHLDVGTDGSIYVADRDSRRVRRIDGSGVIDTVPGSHVTRLRARSGPDAEGAGYGPFDPPRTVAVAADGTVFSAGVDTVRRIGPGGESERSYDSFADPDDPIETDLVDLAVDGESRVYVLSENGRVFRLAGDGRVTPIAGGGSLTGDRADGARAVRIRFGTGADLAADARGNIYVTQAASVWRIGRDGVGHRVAGGSRPGYSGDGGPADEARLGEDLRDVAVGRDGNVYVLDASNGVLRTIDESGVISTVGPAGAAGRSFDAVAVDRAGTAYFASGNRIVRVAGGYAAPGKPVPAAESRFADESPGTVRTVAGNGEPMPEPVPTEVPRYTGPARGAVGADGSYYLAYPAESTVTRISPAGEVSVIAGNGERGSSGDGGPATEARLDTPVAVAIGGEGELYIADEADGRVRRVGTDGRISTYAGGGVGDDVEVGGPGIPAADAAIRPSDLAVGADGSLYLAEAERERISRVDPSGTVTIVAGGGRQYRNEAEGRPAAEASLSSPAALAMSPAGDLVFVERYGQAGSLPAVRMIDADGIVRTVAGDSALDPEDGGYEGDGGPATEARLNTPWDVAVGADGTVYIADMYNARVRAVGPDGTIRTVAGTGARADTGDGAGPQAAAVNEPETVDVGPGGALYLVNRDGDRARVVEDGSIRTFAELPEETGVVERAPATEIPLGQVTAMAVDRAGTLYFRDTLNRATPYLQVDRGGMADEAVLGDAGWRAIAASPDGAMYVADSQVVRRVLPDGRSAVVAGNEPAGAHLVAAEQPSRVRGGTPATTAAFASIRRIDVTPDGELLIDDVTGIYRVGRDGRISRVVRYEAGEEAHVEDMAAGPEGSVYVADTRENRVFRFDRDGERSVVAGNGEDRPADDVEGADATEVALSYPSSIAVDPDGVLFVSGFEGIRRVDDGEIGTVYRNHPDADGSRTSFGPMAVDAEGNLYVSDGGNDRILVIAVPAKDVEPIWPALLWIIGVATVLAGGFWGYHFARIVRSSRSA